MEWSDFCSDTICKNVADLGTNERESDPIADGEGPERAPQTLCLVIERPGSESSSSPMVMLR